MPAKKAKKKVRKPVKFREIKLKLTARQKKSLLNYCKIRRTTPTKLIKKSIRPMLEDYADAVVEKKPTSKVKQLELFHLQD